MKGEATVKSVSKDMAVVTVSRSSACGHDCASCGACSNPSYDIAVYNPLKSAPGDRVIVESASSSILAVSLILYILPVFLLILAAAVCREYSLGYISLVVFLGLGILWFVCIRYANKKIKIKNTITQIISSSLKED